MMPDPAMLTGPLQVLSILHQSLYNFPQRFRSIASDKYDYGLLSATRSEGFQPSRRHQMAADNRSSHCFSTNFTTPTNATIQLTTLTLLVMLLFVLPGAARQVS